MHLHLCDFCGEKMRRAAAVLAIAPPEDPDKDPLTRQMERMFGGGAPVKQFELCEGCVGHLLGIKEHLEAVRPPVKSEPGNALVAQFWREFGKP